MDLGSLRRAARKYIKETTASNPTPEFAPIGPLSTDVQALSLASLTESLGISRSGDGEFQVGVYQCQKKAQMLITVMVDIREDICVRTVSLRSSKPRE